MRSLLFALGVVLVVGHPAAAQDRVALDLNTHSTVTIDRPAAVIWPYILEPNVWKQGTDLTHHSGPTGTVGEVFAAVDAENPGVAVFLAEIVELVPNQRRTIKLYEAGGKLLGFASWTLVESAGRTVVGYDVFSESLLTPAQAGATDATELAAQRQQYFESNRQRFDAELQALKRLVEAAR